MKRVLVVILGLICLLMVGKVWADCTFSDVSESHPFYDEITGICELGITTGYPDGTFRPANNVTRQAMAAFLWGTIDMLKPESLSVADYHHKSTYSGLQMIQIWEMINFNQ